MHHAPHIPVLLDETINSFNTVTNGVFIDCTLGYGGHSKAMLDKHDDISLIGIDKDSQSHQYCIEALVEYSDRITLCKGNFSDILRGVDNKEVVAILADFGVSSLQLDDLDRGFSFNSMTLDMRMDQDAKLTAGSVVNEYSTEGLARIFKDYGEIPEATLLAEAIVDARNIEEITSSRKLAKIISQVVYGKGKIHPATLAFQAIRIEVNDELGEIERMLNQLEKMELSGTIVSIITFHSLEDRLVKNRFRTWAKNCICPDGVMRCQCGNDNAIGKIINRKPIVASTDEIRTNPRSRSAKLRSFRFKEKT